MNRNFKALFGGGCPATDYYVKVQGCGRNKFELALALAFNEREALYWTVTESHGLIFFWYLPAEEVGRNDNTLKLSETSWDATYIHHETKQYLYTLKSTEWEHEVIYHQFDAPQCLGQCLDIAWNWIEHEASYPPKPQYDYYKEGYNGCSMANPSGYEDGDSFNHIAGFEVGTHLDRFRSIHHCEGAICYVRPSWLKEY